MKAFRNADDAHAGVLPIPIGRPSTMRKRSALPGVKVAAAAGLMGKEQPHILTYDPGRIMTYSALAYARDLTVFSSPMLWLGHIAYVAYAMVVMVILGFTAFPDGDRGMSGPACAAGKNIKVCQLNSLLAEAKFEFRFLIAFVLAGFVAGTVRMWGVRRQNYASLCGNARNLNIQISSLLPVNGGAAMAERRMLLCRWVMLAYELAFMKARGLMDAVECREHLQQVGLLAKGEWDAMVPGDRHSTVFWWIQVRWGSAALECSPDCPQPATRTALIPCGPCRWNSCASIERACCTPSSSMRSPPQSALCAGRPTTL